MESHLEAIIISACLWAREGERENEKQRYIVGLVWDEKGCRVDIHVKRTKMFYSISQSKVYSINSGSRTMIPFHNECVLPSRFYCSTIRQWCFHFSIHRSKRWIYSILVYIFPFDIPIRTAYTYRKHKIWHFLTCIPPKKKSNTHAYTPCHSIPINLKREQPWIHEMKTIDGFYLHLCHERFECVSNSTHTLLQHCFVLHRNFCSIVDYIREG